MLFGGTMKRVIKHILAADPRLGPVYLRKVDPEDTYMRLWVRVEDTPITTFIIPKKNRGDEQFVGFHLSPPMGFHDSASFF